MKVLSTCVAIAIVGWMTVPGVGQSIEPNDRANLIGVWSLVSLQDHRPNGNVLDWMGKNPTGTLVYSPDGRVSVQIMQDPSPTAAVPMWSSDGRELLPSASASDIRDAYRGYYAYFGTWTINERAHAVTHHIRASLRSVEIGADYVRPYEFSGDRLLLRSTVVAADGERQARVITWRRAERF